MKPRTIEEIEQAFRDMGLTEKTWGRPEVREGQAEPETAPIEQVFIRMETTTTPLDAKTNADLA